MKLVFDARYIRTDRHHDGISRYSLELAHAVKKRITKHVELVFLVCNDDQITLLPKGAVTKKIHSPTSIEELTKTVSLLNELGPDVVFSPMQTMPTRSRTYKVVLTLHDVIYHSFKTPPKELSMHIRFLWWMYHATYLPQRIKLNGADAVATVSNTSKQQIKKARLTKRPVVVLPNAPSLSRGKPTKQYGSKDLIYMGSFMPYKNVETLVAAMKDLPNYKLHLLSPISDKRKKELTKLAEDNVVFHNGVSDKTYTSMLASGAVLLSASKAEGYGLPIAEAISAGAPVVCSDIPIFREVTGDSAIYFSPANAKELSAKVRLLEKPFIRKQVVADGTKHIKQYSWDKTAKALLKEAENLLK